MSTAKDINKLLDEYSKCRKDFNEIKEKYESNPDFTLHDKDTGETVAKDFVLNKASGIMEGIGEEIKSLTNGGKNCRDLFTNQYYINDMSQDKQIAEEIRANKLKEEIEKQQDSNN
jgi:hypothetical protein